MDKILDTLLTLSSRSKSLSDEAYDRQLTSIIHALNKVGANLMISVPGAIDYLDVLSPSEHSVGYLYILLANIRQKTLEHGNLWRQTVGFLENYDSRQIAYVQDQFRALVGEVVRFVDTIGKPLLVVRPLKRAIQRSSRPSHFSHLHHAFVRKCIEAKCYRDAAAILDIDITDFPSKKEARELKELNYQDVLEYFLYGGMIYIGLKDWRRALDFLTYAVAYPAGASCSTIQMEAYKKYLLVGLLLEGKHLNIPSGTSPIPTRTYRVLAKPYESFTAAFKSGDAEALRKQAALCMPIFLEDGNAGLATQCMDAFRRFQIAGLTHTYVTLSVKEITRRDLEVMGRGNSEEETERCVLAMIERDEIRASLSHESPSMPNPGCIIHFHNNPYSEKRNLRALEEQIMRTVSITNQAKTLERSLGLSKEYLQYLNRASKTGGGGSGQGSGSLADPDLMDTGDIFDYLPRSSTGYSFDDDDLMANESFDED